MRAQTRSGARIDKKYLHKLLRNRIYLGELSHKGNWYPGAHPAIIEHGLWGRVHEILAKDSHARSVETKIRSRTDALLRGLLYGPTGERMYPTYSRKRGRKYHYYVSKSESRFGAAGKTYERIPAEEVEAATVVQIKTVLSSPEAIASVCQFIKKGGAKVDEDTAVMAMHRLGNVWDQLYPVERHRIVNLMVKRIDLVPGGLKVKWRELGWKDLDWRVRAREHRGRAGGNGEGGMNDDLETFVPLVFKRRGVQRLAATMAPAHDTTFLAGVGSRLLLAAPPGHGRHEGRL